MNALQWIGLGQPVYLPRASPTFAMGSTARKTLVEGYSPIPNTSDSIYISVISFKLEDIILRVPRFAFEERFKEELSRSEGTDLNPIILRKVKLKEFNILLRILFPGPSALLNRKLNLSNEEWIIALRLSCLLKFDTINKLATIYLDDIDPITKLVLFKEINIIDKDWVYPPLLELVKRREPLSDHEANLLGMKMSMRIFKLRHNCMEKVIRDTKSRSTSDWWDIWNAKSKIVVGEYTYIDEECEEL